MATTGSLTIAQIDLHARQRNIGVRFVNAVAVHVVPHLAGEAGRDVFTEIVVDADRSGAQRYLAEQVGSTVRRR